MVSLRSVVIQLVAILILAAGMELILPEGRLRASASMIAGLMVTRLLLNVVIALFRAWG